MIVEPFVELLAADVAGAALRMVDTIDMKQRECAAHIGWRHVEVALARIKHEFA